MFSKLSIFMIPPFLTLVVGISLVIISISRGPRKSENLLFSLLCVWWCMLSPLFILHHLIDEDKIVTIERSVHFFYVYIPVIYLLFFHKILNIRRNYVIFISIAICFLLSLSTMTDYYIEGLYRFNWGYIAKGGIAFQVFGLYGIIIMIYLIVCVVQNLKKEKNRAVRLRNKYILVSFLVTGFLTILNLPAINGIDFYPAGNFSFIPLAILAYGVLKYRLLEIRSFLHITLFWFVTSSIIILPNVVLFYFLKPYFHEIDTTFLFMIFVMWFLANHFYISRVQPRINNIYNRMKHRLNQAEVEFVKNIALIKGKDELINESVNFLKKALSFEYIDMFRRVENTDIFISTFGQRLKIDENIEKLFLRYNKLIDRNTAEKNSYFLAIRDKLSKAFDEFQSSYMIPFVYNNRLIALLFFPEPSTYKLSQDEMDFINRIMISGPQELMELDAP